MKEPICVAMIIQRYYPHVGGAERQLAAVAPLLEAQGVKIHVITQRNNANLKPFEVIDGVPVHRLPMLGPKAAASLIFTLVALPLLRRLRPHLIHAHGLFSPATTAVAAKRLFGIPIVAKVMRGGSLGDLTHLRRETLGEQRIAAIGRGVDTFITISREIDEELAEIGVLSDRRQFIPNGVDVERFSPLSADQKRDLRVSLGLPDGPIAIFTGRLDPEKRVDHLISIWPVVRKNHPEALLLLLGTGSEEAKLKQLAGAGVQFLGRVEDVAPYLQAADLFVLPSATEGLSNALLEALAAGLPTVATEIGGASDVIEHGSSGWLIPPDDVPALQEGILTLLADADRRNCLGHRGRERVVEHYALPATASHLRELYDHLINGR